MSDITAKEIESELKAAIRKFGKYSYEDKGAFEILDVDAMAERIAQLEPDAAADLMDVLYKKPINHRLISDLVVVLQGCPDDWFEAFIEGSGAVREVY